MSHVQLFPFVTSPLSPTCQEAVAAGVAVVVVVLVVFVVVFVVVVSFNAILYIDCKMVT